MGNQNFAKTAGFHSSGHKCGNPWWRIFFTKLTWSLFITVSPNVNSRWFIGVNGTSYCPITIATLSVNWLFWLSSFCWGLISHKTFHATQYHCRLSQMLFSHSSSSTQADYYRPSQNNVCCGVPRWNKSKFQPHPELLQHKQSGITCTHKLKLELMAADN